MIAADVTNNPLAQQHIRQRTFGTNNDSKIARQIIGNTVGTGLTIATPELKGAGLAKKVVSGAGIGAGLNSASTLENGGNAKQIAQSAAIGGAFGGALPVAAKIAKPVAKVAANKTAEATNLRFNGLPKKQVIMDTKKLDTINNAKQVLTTNQAPAPTRNAINEGLHQIKDQHGLDFISGSRADRIQRISQYLEQNGEAIPKYQNYLSKPRLATNQIGAVGKDVQNTNKVPRPTTPPFPKTPLAPVIDKNANKVLEQGSGIKSEQNPIVTQNSLTAGGKAGRQNISPEVQSQISGEGSVRNTQQLADTAVLNADKQGLQKTIDTAHEALSVPQGQIDDATVAHVQQAIERADTAGRINDAVGLHDALSEHLRKQGQTIQAASLLYRLSPRGLLYKGLGDLKKGGAEVTPELQNKLSDLADNIKNAKNQADKERARAEFQKAIVDNIPKSKMDSALSVWKAGLLSGVKTQAGNFASNATFGGLKAASNPISAGIDRLLSLKTGERTKTATVRGLGSGTRQGIGTGIDTLKTGIDSRNIDGGKYEVHGELNFKNPVIQKVFGSPSNLVFRGMNAADQPFYYAALKNNLYDLARADGINKGLKGKDLRTHVTNTVANPSTRMAETAKLSAQKAVLGQDSKIASAVTELTHKIPGAQVLAPFVKVPTNFLTRSLDYSPVGAVKEVVKQARSGQLDQRALSEALGEATTGSAVIFMGAELAKSNLLSGQYPSSDPKEAQRWKAEGITPNSIKIGNKWVSLNYLGPAGLLLGAGKDYHDAAARGDNGAVAAISGTAKNLTGQSFLTGFSGFSNAINDPQRSAKSFINSEAGSVVPSWSNDVANFGDQNQRETNNVPQSIKARIPGARNSLPIKQDVYGNDLKQRTDPINLLANPLRPSDVVTNDVKGEVSRLHNVDPNNKDLQVTPTPVDKAITVEKNKVKLTDTQRHDLQKQIGQTTQGNWSKLIKTPEYQQLSDADKATALDNLRKTSTELATRDYVVSNNLAQYQKPASNAAADLATGGSVTNAIKSSDGSTSSNLFYKSPDAEYRTAQAKFDNNVKNNAFKSPAEQIRAKNNVAKLKAGSTFDKTTRDLYGLSDKDLYAYVSGDPNGNAIAQKVIDYGNALVAAGIDTKNKFVDKYGNVTLGKSSVTTSSSGKSSKAKKAKIAKIKAPKASKFKQPKFAAKSPKAPSFKSKRAKIPSYAVKTPKVTAKNKAIV